MDGIDLGLRLTFKPTKFKIVFLSFFQLNSSQILLLNPPPKEEIRFSLHLKILLIRVSRLKSAEIRTSLFGEGPRERISGIYFKKASLPIPSQNPNQCQHRKHHKHPNSKIIKPSMFNIPNNPNQKHTQ